MFRSIRKALWALTALALCFAGVAQAQVSQTGGGTAKPGGAASFVLNYATTVSAAVGFANSQVFNAVPIGTATSDRIVDIAFGSDNEAGSGFTAPTICGVTGTLAKSDGATPVKTANYYANVTTGTTCTITINGNAISGLVMVVWDIHGQAGGAAATPTSSAYGTSAAADPPGVSLAVTTSAGGDALVYAGGNASGVLSANCSWTNASGNGAGGGAVGGNNYVGCGGTASSSATVTVASGTSSAFGFGAPIISVSWGP